VSSATLAHSPFAPHLLHAEQLASLQHTPSVQSLLAQASLLVPQGEPSGSWFTHFCPMHSAPPVQSAFAVQLVMQVFVSAHT
jgi:hypothetical protein